MTASVIYGDRFCRGVLSSTELKLLTMQL